MNLKQSFKSIDYEQENGIDNPLKFRFLSISMIMLVARAVILLVPIFYTVIVENKNLISLLNDNLFFHLYFLLAFFDLFCFIETYYVKKRLEVEPESAASRGILLTLMIVQTLTLNAMFIGSVIIFLYQNKGQIRFGEKIKTLSPKQIILILVNLFVLGGSLGLFFYMLSLYIKLR